MLAIPTSVLAQELPTKDANEGRGTHLKLTRIEWNSEEGNVVWHVQKGYIKDDKFVPEKTLKYEIDFEKSIILVDGKHRDINQYEGTLIYRINKNIEQYLIESSAWWEEKEKEEIKKGKNHKEGRISPKINVR
jgi:hypothetical protein